jgi:hypothetical protein
VRSGYLVRPTKSVENKNRFQHQPYLENFMRILIVEDDSALSSFIRKGLEAEHHAVDVANEGNPGRSMAMEFDYDFGRA